MQLISLSAYDLGLAAALVIFLALLSLRMQLGVASQILIAASRTVVTVAADRAGTQGDLCHGSSRLAGPVEPGHAAARGT